MVRTAQNFYYWRGGQIKGRIQIERIKGLISMTDRRIVETSGVGLSAIMQHETKYVYWCDNYTEYMSIASEDAG